MLVSSFISARRRLRHWWGDLTPRRRELAQNVFIGAIISIVLSPIESNVAVGSVRDTLLTWQAGQFVGTDIGRSLALIDIDDTTYAQKWRAPFVTPRDKLCRLVDYASRGGAKAIVVDIELSARDSSQRRAVSCDSAAAAAAPAKPGQRADDVFAAYLRAYAVRCSSAFQDRATTGPGAPCPPILLTRSLRTSPTDEYGTGAIAREPRASFLDPLGAQSGAVAWGTSTFHRDADFMLRGWRLWEPVCGRGRPHALPSIEVLAVAAYNDKDIRKLQGALDVSLAPACRLAGERTAAADMPREPLTLDIGYPLALRTGDLERRFFYRFGWAPGVEHPAIGRQLGVIIPAWEITDIDPAHRFDPSQLRGKIVVIGGTFGDNPDYHRTPLGEMPGTIVLLNAINALLHDDHVRDIPWPLRFSVEAALILIVSLLYFYLPHRQAMLTAYGIIAVAAVTVGYILLNRGYFIDPVLPALGIQVHELLSGIHGRLFRRGTA